MNKTGIEWVKNPDGTQGYTWNPITGCLNQIGGMCKGGGFPCYAYRLANGRLKARYLANNCLATGAVQPSELEAHYKKQADPFYPRFWEDRLMAPLKHKKPAGIFPCDMSDLFGIGIPEDWTNAVMGMIVACPHHRFYPLTKQPQNLIKFNPFPENCYIGVTVTKPEFLIPALDAFDSIQCAIRYLSIEPMLASFDMPGLSFLLGGSVNQVIIGAQTKPYKPPDKVWVVEIIEACKKAGIPYFLKDNLRSLMGNDLVQDMPRGVEVDH